MVYFPGPELDQHEDRKLSEIFNALFDVYWKQYVKKKTFINLNQPSAAERAVSARGWFCFGVPQRALWAGCHQASSLVYKTAPAQTCPCLSC